MQVIRIIAISSLFVSGACTTAADMEREVFERSHIRMPFAERLRKEATAPVIVLGKVTAVTEIGSPIASAADSRIYIQRTRVEVDLEEVIKGDIPADTIEFEFFRYSPDLSRTSLLADRYTPQIGQHRIWFLTATNGTYRSVADVLDYTLRVSSGRYTRGFCGGKSPGCCIAEILLSPQHGMDIETFGLDLITSEYAAEILCSRSSAQTLMFRLTEHPDKRIAQRAQEVVAGTKLSK